MTIKEKNTGCRFAPWELEALAREHGQDLVDEIVRDELFEKDGQLVAGRIVGVGSHGFVVELEDGSTTHL